MAETDTTASSTPPTPIPTALNVTALAKQFGVARSTIQRRMKKGWTPYIGRALTLPTTAHACAIMSAFEAIPD